MLNRHNHSQSICRKCFRLTIFITSAVLVCFHKSIDAFSPDFLSFKAFHDRKPLDTFVRLKATDKKDDSDMMSKYELFRRGYDGNSNDNSPFFAERTDQFQNGDDITSIQNSSDATPFFAQNTKSPYLDQRSQQTQVPGNKHDEDTKTVKAQKSIETRSDDKSFYTPIQNIPMNSKATSDVGEESEKMYSDTQISLLKRARNEDLSKVVDSFQALVDEMPEVFAVALIKSLQLNLDESLEGIQYIPNKANTPVQGKKLTVEDTAEKTPKTANDVQDIPNQIKQSVEDTKRKIWNNQEPVKEAFDLAGKATLATAKLAFWIGKGAGSLAWKGSRSVYESTIGPKVDETWNTQMDSLNDSINTATTFIQNTPSRLTSAVKKSTELDPPSDSVSFAKNQPQRNQRDLASASSSASFINQPEGIERGSAPVSSSTNFEKKPKSIERSDDSGSGNPTIQPTNIQRDAASISNRSNSVNQRPNIDQVPAPASSNTNTRKLPAFVSRIKLGGANNREKIDRSKTDVDGKSKKLVAKPAAKILVKSPEGLRIEIERAQILAKEISDALDVAERAMKLKPDFKLEDPMIGIEKLKPMDGIKPEVRLPPQKKSKRKSKIRTVAKNVISFFKPAKSQDGLDAEFKTLDAEFRTVKSRNDLDAGLMEVEESLAREIADALEAAEQALMMASTDGISSDISVDQAIESRAP